MYEVAQITAPMIVSSIANFLNGFRKSLSDSLKASITLPKMNTKEGSPSPLMMANVNPKAISVLSEPSA